MTEMVLETSIGDQIVDVEVKSSPEWVVGGYLEDPGWMGSHDPWCV